MPFVHGGSVTGTRDLDPAVGLGKEVIAQVPFRSLLAILQNEDCKLFP